jgi:DNA-binding transcriptional ArsR family regulator
MTTKSKDDAPLGGIDQKVVKALAHPIRVRVLTLLNQKVASPSELAEEIGEPLGNVSYHVRTLVDLGCIELVRTAPRRGAVEHYYRALTRPIFSEDDWGRMPPSLKRSVAGAVLSEVWRDVNTAARSNGFDRDDVHLARTPLTLDAQGWQDLHAELDRLLERAIEIQAESASRLHGEGEAESEPAELVTMLFQVKGQPEGAQPDGKRGRARKRTPA